MRNELQRHKRSDKVKWVFTGIMFILAFVMIAGLALQVFGTGKTKPSEWFKSEKQEETETIEEPSGEESASAFSITPSAVSYSAVSTYAETETVTPSCEHLPKTIESSDDLFTLTLSKVSNTSCHVGFSDPVISRERDYVDTESVHYAEYTKTYQHSPSVFWCYKVGIWCIHDFRSYCIQEYGYFYSNLRYNISSCQNAMSAWQSSGVSPVTTESYDSTSDILTIKVDATLKGQSSENYLPLYFDSYGLAPDGFLFYGSQTKYLPSDPVKEGYTFTGWYTDEECTNRYFGSEVTSDITLYAGWQINTYTLTLKGNGGEISQTTISGDYNTIPEIPTPTRTGYNFTGWKTADGQEYDVSNPFTQDLTLTAQWEIKTYTVTFMVDGAVYQTMTVEHGTSLKYAAESINLSLMSVYSESGVMAYNENGEMIVVENYSVEAQEMSTTDKAINFTKRNKWAIIGGVAGGVALIAIIAAVCGSKRKRKR